MYEKTLSLSSDKCAAVSVSCTRNIALTNSPLFKSIFEERALLNAQQKIKNKNKPTHY